MDIKHELGGDMEIELSEQDIQLLQQIGYCENRYGLCGPDTKTWVREDSFAEAPNAQIDAASDVYVQLPNGVSDLPVRIDKNDIDPYMDSDRERVNFYFGETGAIIVRLANS